MRCAHTININLYFGPLIIFCNIHNFIASLFSLVFVLSFEGKDKSMTISQCKATKVEKESEVRSIALYFYMNSNVNYILHPVIRLHYFGPSE